MSVKYFCDQCGFKLTDENSIGADRLKSRYKNLQFEVMMGPVSGPWNSGDWCKYCIIDAVKSCDDRPTEGK
jgi:hypothetical protein